MTKNYNQKCNTCKHRYIVINEETDSSYCACYLEFQPYHTDCGKYEEGNADRTAYLSME